MQSRFAALQNMDAFSEDMFNRIIDFQEKKHPAWDVRRTFDERIKDLALHYLVFSSADRDPTRYAPTVAYYYPFRAEINRLYRYHLALNACGSVCELFPGNGFIGSLLAREGMNVTGLRAYKRLPNQIEQFHDPACYNFSDGRLADHPCDAVVLSWIPSEVNPTPEIVSKAPKLISYIYSEHRNPDSGIRQSGHDAMFDGLDDYRLLDTWYYTRPANLFHDVWPDLTPSVEETRHTRVYVRRDQPSIDTISDTPNVSVYDWEKEHEMALLALQAKQWVEQHQS